MAMMQRKVRVIGVKAPPPPGSDENPSETVQLIFALGFLGFVELGCPEDWWIAAVIELVLAVLVLLVRSFS